MVKISIPARKGFSILHSFDSWRVAISISSGRENVIDVSRHNYTDECFFLIDGGGYLITAKEKDSSFDFEVVRIEKDVVYTIKKGEWHSHCWDENTRVLIFENDNTCDLNSDKHYLDEGEKARLNLLLQ